MDIVSFLIEAEVFRHMHRDAAERLAVKAVEERFPPRHRVIRRGEAGDCMYLIVEGQVLIPVYGEDGTKQFVAQLGPKQIFGEMALLTGEARVADVITASDCRFLKLQRDAVERVIVEEPAVAQLLTAILGERLIQSGTIRQIGNYKLTGEIGRGGMSIVYEGVHPVLERTVAIKMLSHQLVYRPKFSERFRNEARIISRLRHPHIVEVYDTESAYATFFIVMERLHGVPLDEQINARGRLSPSRARAILRQLASALREAHSQGIVHRDVKPSNIMVAPDSTVKLMDFGLAMASGMQGDPESESLSGTPMYMAPEHIDGEPLDARADIYSLGVMVFEMLTGKPPFQGKFYEVLEQQRTLPVPSVRERIGDHIPEDLEEFVRRATAKSPADRFQDCDEILTFLAAPKGLSDLTVETVTFLYPPSQEDAVKELIEEFRRRASGIENLVVHS